MQRDSGYIPVVGTGVPSLTTDKVTVTGPPDGVLTARTVGVGGIGLAISPPRVEEAVVGSLGGGSTGTRSEGLAGGGHDTGDGSHGGDEESREVDHFELLRVLW